MTRLLRVGLPVTLAALLLSGCGFVNKLKARDRLNKGVAAYKDENYAEAVSKFKESIELDPQFANAWLYLATAYRQMYVPGSQTEEHREHARQAIETYEKVLELDPRNLNAMASIAGIYNDTGEHEKAKDWYRKRLEIEPNNPEPLYGIGQIDHSVSFSRTGQLGEGVENMSPEEIAQSMTLVDEGISALQKATEMNPKYWEAYSYTNLLFREKAKLTSDKTEKETLLRQADQYASKALVLKREAEEKAAEAARTGEK